MSYQQLVIYRNVPTRPSGSQAIVTPWLDVGRLGAESMVLGVVGLIAPYTNSVFRLQTSADGRVALDLPSALGPDGIGLTGQGVLARIDLSALSLIRAYLQTAEATVGSVDLVMSIRRKTSAIEPGASILDPLTTASELRYDRYASEQSAPLPTPPPPWTPPDDSLPPGTGGLG